MGMSLLLLVFFVLVLSLFAALTLSTAKKDSVLSAETALRKTQYYSAVSRAEELLSKTDGLAAEAYAKADNEQDYFSLLYASAAALEGAQPGPENSTLSFNIIINDRQSLYILLDLSYPSAGEGFYSIRTYKSVSSGPFEAENRLNLISFDN